MVMEGSHKRERSRSPLNSNRVTVPVDRQAMLKRRREQERQQRASEKRKKERCVSVDEERDKARRESRLV